MLLSTLTLTLTLALALTLTLTLTLTLQVEGDIPRDNVSNYDEVCARAVTLNPDANHILYPIIVTLTLTLNANPKPCTLPQNPKR